MRKDPITDELFEPRTKEHFFKTKANFEAFIERLDPVDEIKEVKREINWSPITRTCINCDAAFIATHPARVYCENCREEEEEHNEEMKTEENLSVGNGIIRR